MVEIIIASVVIGITLAIIDKRDLSEIINDIINKRK